MQGSQKGIFELRNHLHACFVESGSPTVFCEETAFKHCQCLYGGVPSVRTWQRWKSKAMCSHDRTLTGGQFSYVSYALLLAIAYNLRGSSQGRKVRNFTQRNLYQYGATFADNPAAWLSLRWEDLSGQVFTPQQCEEEIQKRLGVRYSPSRLRKAGLYRRVSFYSKAELIQICNRLLGINDVKVA